MRRLSWLPLFWSIAVLPVAGGESETALDWLKQMNRAVSSLDYEGVFVYLHDSQLETMRILHRTEDGHETERLSSLNGAARLLVGDDGSVICTMQESQRISVDKPLSRKRFPLPLPTNLDSLTRYYRFHYLGRDRIAGRLCKVIAIIPKDTYRYGYRLYLDEETALPLKSDLMDETGHPVAQIMFTSLKIDPGFESEEMPEKQELSPEIDRNKARHYRNSRIDSSRWAFKWVPEGFKRSADNQWVDPNDGTKVEQIVLSDGLASLSVYIELPEQGHDDELNGGSKVGAVNAWGRTLGSYQVTAVGEVPKKTVRMVVEALEYTRPD